jgi:acetoin utilization deacetylase AcuC-like enzyme
MHTFYYPQHQAHDPAVLHRQDDDHWNRYYTEVAERGQIIYDAIQAAQLGPVTHPGDFGLSAIQDVHAHELITLLQNAHEQMKLETGRDVAIAETFSLRPRSQRHFYSVFGQLGRYCFDTSSPIFAQTWQAAYWSVQTAVSAAALTLANQAANHESIAYALCRPPGHHAAADQFGGFCYLNNVAIAANWLVQQGQRVAILDVDYHHGNGTQEIFYGRSDVLFISIHADPRYEYPFYWGFADEYGSGPGLGFNHNYPLPPGTQAAAYLASLTQALSQIRAFVPDTLLISLGVDTGEKDPTGTFLLDTPDFAEMGQRIGQLSLPMVVVQEGGYRLETLGQHVIAFLNGLRETRP